MAKRIEVEVDVNTKGAVKDVDKLNDSFEDLSESADDSSESLSNVEEGLDGLGGGFGAALQGAKGLLSGFKALIANPIGLTIAAIAAVATTLYTAFTRTEEGSNSLNKGMNLLKAGFSSFMKVVEPIAEFIVDGIAAAIEDAGKAIDEFISNLETSLEFFGFEDAAKSVKDFADGAVEAGKKIEELSDLEAKLLKTRREQRLINKQALIDAEDERQIRDDISRTIEERQAANTRLGAILKKQASEELAIANDALRVANLKLEIDGKTTENLDEQTDALEEVLDIKEKINGFESEQLTNVNSLNEEQKAEHEEHKVRQNEKIAKLEQIKNALIENNVEEEGVTDFDEFGDIEETDYAAEEKKAEEELDKKAENAKREFEIEQDLALKLEQIRKDEVKAASDASIAKMKIQEQYVGAISNGVNTIIGLAGDSKEAQAAAIIAENAAGIAKMVISNNIANTGALATPQAILTSGVSAVPTITANNISTGINIAASIAATAKGLSALKKSGGAGSSPALGGGGGSASAPTINQETLFPTETLEGAESEDVGTGGGLNQQPLRAVVLESDITNTQNTINNLKQRSEIG